MHLGNLIDIKQKDEWLALMLKMNCPSHKGTVIGGRPRISGEADPTVVVLAAQYLIHVQAARKETYL